LAVQELLAFAGKYTTGASLLQLDSSWLSLPEQTQA